MMVEYVDPYPGRKGSERVEESCGACSGTGLYGSYTRYLNAEGDPYCFKCGGSGVYTRLVSSARSTERRRVAETNRQSARAEQLAEIRAAFIASTGDRHRLLTETHIAMRAGDPLRTRVGDLLDVYEVADHVVDADPNAWATDVDELLAEVSERAAAQRQVPTGRLEVVGEVLSTKWIENDFGGALKMLVQGEGWKVWGTVPSALRGSDELKGQRVTFTASIEASADDPAFGYYSRPTKAAIIEVQA